MSRLNISSELVHKYYLSIARPGRIFRYNIRGLARYSVHCTFYCHRVVKIMAPVLACVGPNPLAQNYRNGPSFHREKVVFVLKSR